MNPRRVRESAEVPSGLSWRESNLLNAVLAGRSDFVVLSDRAGAVLYLSPPAIREWAGGRSQLNGLTLADLEVPDELRQVLLSQRQAILDNPREGAENVRLTSRDGRTWECLFTTIPAEEPEFESIVATIRDMTPHLQVEEALQRSEEQYRLLAEHASDMISRHDVRGVYLYASPACRRLLGFEPAELVGRSAYEFIHPGDVAEVARSHSSVLMGPDTVSVSYRIRCKNGGYIWYETTARSLRDPHTNQIVEITCSSRDVSARRWAEQELRESRELLQAILDNSTAVVFIKDAEGHYILANRQFESLFKLSRDELVGKTDHDMFPKELADAFRANDQRVFESASAIEFEELVPHEDGIHTYISIKFPIRDPLGILSATCGISTDITARKQAQEALREKTEILQSILASMADAVIVADRDEHFLVFNPAAERMFGIGATDTTSAEWPRQYGLYLSDQVTPFPAAGLPLARSIRGEEVNDVEMFVRHPGAPDGIWTLINGRPLRDENGKPWGGVIVCHDVTRRRQRDEQIRLQNVRLQEVAFSERQAHEARKLAESQLIQAEKLTALGQMVAGVAHEINNPLAFVINNLAVLRRFTAGLRETITLYREADPTLAQHDPALFARIHTLTQRIDLTYAIDNLDGLMDRSSGGLKRIQQIVKDLRNFARLDESDLNEVDLNEGIRSTLNIVAGQAKDRDVAFEQDLACLPPVECYPGKINQVVLNLLTNALDACSPGGKVTVRTVRVGDSVEIHVADTGHGIDPAIRNKIFDPFFTTKPIGHGTGLGLSISYGIVKSHGGHIDVDSTPGHGSRFVVSLPCTFPPRTDGQNADG